MSNITITTNDYGSLVLKNAEYRQDTLLFSAADAWVEGTILARKLINDTIACVITGTGVWTVSGSTAAGRTLQTGAYVATAGTLSSGVGTWTCAAPDGQRATCTTSAASDDLIFEELGLTIVVVDPGSETNFVTGDIVTATVAAQTGTPLVPYAVAGTNGAQVPRAVLCYPITVTSGGSVAADALVKGVVRKDRLIIDADGTGANVTDAVMDLLASTGITVLLNTDVSVLDNGAT